MYACQWHIDIPFGKQKQVVEILSKWNEDMANAPGAPQYLSRRVLVGHIGESPARVIGEYVVESMADWERMMHLVGTGRFQAHSEAIAPHVVPGSQRWIVYRIAQ